MDDERKFAAVAGGTGVELRCLLGGEVTMRKSTSSSGAAVRGLAAIVVSCLAGVLAGCFNITPTPPVAAPPPVVAPPPPVVVAEVKPPEPLPPEPAPEAKPPAPIEP